MGFLSSTEIKGIPGVQSFLLSVESALLGEELLDEVGALLLARNRQRFLDEVDPDGVPWIPSRAGEERRARGDTGTLFDTGRLFHSIQLVNTGTNSRAIQTDVPYAEKHQRGLEGMIQRVFLGFGDSDLEAVNLFLGTRISELLGGVRE